MGDVPSFVIPAFFYAFFYFSFAKSDQRKVRSSPPLWPSPPPPLLLCGLSRGCITVSDGFITIGTMMGTPPPASPPPPVVDAVDGQRRRHTGCAYLLRGGAAAVRPCRARARATATTGIAHQRRPRTTPPWLWLETPLFVSERGPVSGRGRRGALAAAVVGAPRR